MARNGRRFCGRRRPRPSPAATIFQCGFRGASNFAASSLGARVRENRTRCAELQKSYQRVRVHEASAGGVNSMSGPWGPQEPPSWPRETSSFAPALGRPRSRGSVRLGEECSQGNGAGAFFASVLRQPRDVSPGLWDEQPRRPLSEPGAYDSPFLSPTASPRALAAQSWSNPYRRGSARAALADAKRENLLAARERAARAKAAVDVAYQRLLSRSARPRAAQAVADEPGWPLDEADVRLAVLQEQLSLHRSRPGRGLSPSEERAAVAAALMVRYASSLPSLDIPHNTLHE